MKFDDLKVHWDKTYSRKKPTELGWYEENPEPSLSLIQKLPIQKNARILQVGCGASTLVDAALAAGYTGQIATDLSEVALEELKKRLGSDKNQVIWMVDNLVQPTALNLLDPVDLWHDRAVLHFFNEEAEKKAYFSLLRKLVKPEGYVIIAVFNENSAEKCSGLPVHRYSLSGLQSQLGEEFSLLESFDYTYQMPSGDTREYVYAVFVRDRG